MNKKDILKIVGLTTVLVGVFFMGRYLLQNRKRKVTTKSGDYVFPEEVGLILDSITRETSQQPQQGSSTMSQPSRSVVQQQWAEQVDANNNGLIDATEGGVTTNSAGEIVDGVPTYEYLQQLLDNN
jgi:hypothetical protein